MPAGRRSAPPPRPCPWRCTDPRAAAGASGSRAPAPVRARLERRRATAWRRRVRRMTLSPLEQELVDKPCEPAPALRLLRQGAFTRARQRVELGFAVRFRPAPGALDPALLLHADERRIQRALVERQRMVRHLRETGRERVGMKRPHVDRARRMMRSSVPCSSSTRPVRSLGIQVISTVSFAWVRLVVKWSTCPPRHAAPGRFGVQRRRTTFESGGCPAHC